MNQFIWKVSLQCYINSLFLSLHLNMIKNKSFLQKIISKVLPLLPELFLYVNSQLICKTNIGKVFVLH